MGKNNCVIELQEGTTRPSTTKERLSSVVPAHTAQRRRDRWVVSEGVMKKEEKTTGRSRSNREMAIT